jgi:hypothetical protein
VCAVHVAERAERQWLPERDIEPAALAQCRFERGAGVRMTLVGSYLARSTARPRRPVRRALAPVDRGLRGPYTGIEIGI